MENQEFKKELEQKLNESVKNRENATRERFLLAEKINYKHLPDSIQKCDQFGFDSSNSNKTVNLLQINARIEKWNLMLKNYKVFSTTKKDKLKKRTRKGIPDGLRSVVWPLFGEEEKFHVKGLFQRYDNIPLDEKIETTIIKDLDRTFPHCFLFKDKYGEGQRKLHRVLSNYAKYNKRTGYVQGMGFIAAVLLLYMDEEKSFFMLDSLMKKYELEGVFLPNFPELNKKFYVLLKLQAKFIPKIFKIFKEDCFSPSMYASEWLICLFTRELDFNAVVRFFDAFLLEKYKIVYRLALALLKLKEKEYLERKDGLVDTMNITKGCTKGVDEDLLFKTAFSWSFSRKDIKAYEEEYEKVKNDKKNEFIKLLEP